MCWTQSYTRNRRQQTRQITQSCVWLCPTYIVLCYLSSLSSSRILCMVVSNIHSVVLFVLFVVVLCLVHGCVEHTQDTGRRQTRQIIQHYVCWTQLYTRNRRRQTRQLTQHYMCWTQPYTSLWTRVLYYLSCLSSSVPCVLLCPTHIVLCYLSCLSSSCVLCMAVSNTYTVVLFVLFVIVCVFCMVVSNTYSVVLFFLFVVKTQDDDKQDK
jgi:hypothetical protein